MNLLLLLLALSATVSGQSMPLPRSLPLPEAIAINDESYTSCANANWPPSAVGTELVPQAPDAELVAALAEIDPARIQATILKLVSFGTRHTLSSQTDPVRGIGAARDWIAGEMRSYAARSGGRMTVTVPGYEQPVATRVPFPVRISNVVATLAGASEPGRVYVVTGHYDSRATDPNDYTSDAPGANDDASGVAVAMELARVMATRRPAATLVFGAVAGEEQSLFGSNFMAQTYRNASVDVQGMLNNDIVGSSTGSRGERDPFTVRMFCQGPPLTETAAVAAQRLQIGAENDSPARELGRFVAEVAANEATGMNISMIYRLDRFLRGGDHSSFLQAGFPAVRFTEPNENFDHQHQNVRVEEGKQYGDLPEFVDFDYVSRMAKVNLAAMWSLGNGPGWVRNVTVNTTLLSNDSELKWLPLGADVKGYEVVWRPTTAPLWTHMLDVGNVTKVRVPLSKDNVIFAVRAVGKNGYKGPASIPFSAA
jgi:hypothetical protein